MQNQRSQYLPFTLLIRCTGQSRLCAVGCKRLYDLCASVCVPFLTSSSVAVIAKAVDRLPLCVNACPFTDRYQGFASMPAAKLKALVLRQAEIGKWKQGHVEEKIGEEVTCQFSAVQFRSDVQA